MSTLDGVKPSESDYRSRLALAMRQRNCTVLELARAAGIHRQTIDNIFIGKSQMLLAVNHIQVCWYLKISPSWLAMGDQMNPNEDWPFGNDCTPEQYYSTSEETRASVLAILRDSIARRTKPIKYTTPPRRKPERRVTKPELAGQTRQDD